MVVSWPMTEHISTYATVCPSPPGFSGGGLVARSLLGMGWSLANQSDVDRCHKVCRCIWLEAGVALQVHLDGVTHGLADVGDGDIGGVHPFGVAMPEGIGGELFACCLASTRNVIHTARRRRYW